MFYQLANLIRILVGWKSHQKGSFYNERDNLQRKSKWDFYCDLYCALFLRSFKIHSRGLSDVNTYDPFHPFDIFSHLALRALIILLLNYTVKQKVWKISHLIFKVHIFRAIIIYSDVYFESQFKTLSAKIQIVRIFSTIFKQ